jgi:hypothetical protein
MEKRRIKIVLTDNEIILFMIIIFLFVVLCGVASNIWVLKVNHGKMPFFADYEYEDGIYFSFNEVKPKLWMLSDIISIGNYMASVGDFIILFGGLGFIFFIFVFIYKKRKEAKQYLKQ